MIGHHDAIRPEGQRGKDGKLYLSLVNTNPQDPVVVSVALAGAVARSASGSMLTAAAMDAHNDFAAPRTVVPAPFRADAEGGKLAISLPPKSVAVVAVRE